MRAVPGQVAHRCSAGTATASAARSMSAATSSGRETIGRWLDATSTVAAPILAAKVPLGVRRDRLVVLGDQVPGGQPAPCRGADHLAERLERNRLLDSVHDARPN